ncbi:MAG: TrkA C-terminal domain-containing protein [Candidatus Omnitrophota bacterium]
MNLLLFITILAVSFVIVRIGAIAFELTGLEWSLAKFQALSCFTGTGFTTKEAELITANPQRRRIASVLIVFGHAGLVTLIATFANSLRTPQMTFPLMHLTESSNLLPWINFLVIILAAYIFYKIFSNSRFAAKLTDIIRARIVKKELVKRVSFEELVVATGGYGVSQIEICKDSPVLNKTLIESNLRKSDILLLAVERDQEIIPNPPPAIKILLGDKLICFGKLGNIRKQLCVIPQ